MPVQRQRDDSQRRGLDDGLQLLVCLAQGFGGLLQRLAGAQRADAEGQVAGQLLEQRHLLGVKSVWLSGIKGQDAGRAVLNEHGQGDRRPIAPAQGLFAPGDEGLVVGDGAGGLGRTGADRPTHRALPVLVLRPRDADCRQVIRLVPGPGQRANGARLVVLGPTHPGQPVAARRYQPVAQVVQQGVLVFGAHDHLITLA